MKNGITNSSRLLLVSAAVVGIVACSDQQKASLLNAEEQVGVPSFSFSEDCSAHGAQVKVTFDKNTVKWERSSFYGRTKENVTFTEWNADASVVKDATVNPNAEKNSYYYSSTEYKAAFAKLQQTMKSIVEGYACNQPEPEAKKYAEILSFYPTPSKSEGDKANFNFNEGCSKSSDQYYIAATDSTINWSITKPYSNPYRTGYSLDRKTKQIKYVAINRDQPLLSVAATLTSTGANYKKAVKDLAATLKKVVKGYACNAATPEAQKYTSEVEAILKPYRIPKQYN